MTHLSGKVAVVTGAARGIGAATARRLAEDGATVAVVDLDEAQTKGTVDAILGAGGSAIGVACDVSSEEAVIAAADQIRSEAGSIDVLVNNAGLLRDNLVFKMSLADWDTVMGVHLRGSFLWAREAQKTMVANRWGKIVNLSSTSALGNRGQTNYSAAKAGLQGFTKALAIELGPFNINVNAVAPGFIETEMTRATAARTGVDFEEMKKRGEQAIPLRRVGRPEDIAGVVSALCSEDTSYVSGQVIYVAGGPKA
ncbi:SDR family NAD(P)-dependent oxidoreductase [Streptomyces carpinensis]|uniref:3-oxoacyl-ACP reductase FabG n=1 Tax=Streptomyces carpinensis TaxID=66369 RepID=A0ABV1W4V2_9ACTN|nr:3-oxoacyl-ACP reductase FabG [Streptomyces carpinensis]